MNEFSKKDEKWIESNDLSTTRNMQLLKALNSQYKSGLFNQEKNLIHS